MPRRRKSSKAIVVRPSFGGFRAPSPIVVTRTRTVHAKPKKKPRRHSSGGGGIAGGLTSRHELVLDGAAYVLGYADKQGVKVPTVPVLGRAGSIALGLYLAGKFMRSPMLLAGARAARTIALYELGNKGQVSGVHGVDTV